MQRYFSDIKIGDNFKLNEDDIYHITKVMRMKSKDQIEVVYQNELYICNILNQNNELIIQIDNKSLKNNHNNYQFNIIIPLLKEQKMDLILQKSTELGVSNIYVIKMERSIVKLDENKLSKRLDRWQKICKEASEQSKRTDIPNVVFINDINLLKNLDGNKILCSTKNNLENIQLYLKNNNNCDKINVVIGPEGGITDKEEKLLNQIGYNSISLGKRIMRVETVPIFILSVLNYEYME